MKTLIIVICLALSAAGAAYGREAKCPECKGAKWVYESVECDKCNGAGQVEKRIWDRRRCEEKIIWVRCPKCSRIGSGAKLGMLRVKSKCGACSGTGKIEKPDPEPKADRPVPRKRRNSRNGR